MIRLVQRKLILPRGDTGEFSIPAPPGLGEKDAAVFSIFNPLNKTYIHKVKVPIIDQKIVISFTHEDTVNLPCGKYLWDIKIYKNAVQADGEVINGDEVNSYYAGYTLPQCQIRETSDAYLLADDAPTSTLTPEQLNIITAALAELRDGIAKIQENVTHYPTIIDNYWYVWDAEAGEFVNTNVLSGNVMVNGSAPGSIKIPDYEYKINYVSFTAQQTSSGVGSSALGINTTATGSGSHAEGRSTIANGENSHAEGYSTLANGSFSHAEGNRTQATGMDAHAEGYCTQATNNYSHSEGYITTASGQASHAQGAQTVASGHYSHAEGNTTIASGVNSHAEGIGTEASGDGAHVEGYYTIASGDYQHVQGKYNIEDLNNRYAEIIGIGTYGNNRLNGYTLDWNGNGWYAGKVTVNDTTPTANGDLTSKLYVDSSLENIINIVNTKQNQLTFDNTPTINSNNPVTSNGIYNYINQTKKDINDVIINSSFSQISNSIDWEIGNWLTSDGSSGTNSKMIRTVIDSINGLNYYIKAENNILFYVSFYNNNSHISLTSYPWVSECYIPSIIPQNATSFRLTVKTEPMATLTEIIEETGEKIHLLQQKKQNKLTFDSVPTQNSTNPVTSDGVYNAIANINTMKIHVCTSNEYNSTTGVPTVVSPDAQTFYLVPGGANNNLYIQWVYINNSWEQFGSATIDLTPYALKTELPDISGKADKTNTVLDTTLSRGRKANTTAGTGSFAFGNKVTATGDYSHAEGSETKASAVAAHAEGSETEAKGNYSHAEGFGTTAKGASSHAEGIETWAEASASHAEGYNTDAHAAYSHAEGYDTSTNGQAAHAEGYDAHADRQAAHAEGYDTNAKGAASHSEGYGTIAGSDNQHVQGKYNIEDVNSTYADIVGIGTYDNARANGYTLDWSGNGWFAGKATVGNTTPVNNGDLTSKLYVDTALSSKANSSDIPTNVSDLINDAEYITNNSFIPTPLTVSISKTGRCITYNNGSLGQTQNFNATDYVSIGNWQAIRYKRSKSNSTSSTVGMAFYNSEKQYISGVRALLNQDSFGYYGLYDVTVPENAVYARFSMLADTETYGDFELYGLNKLVVQITNKADTSSLSTVATTGDYSDLNNTPIIPSKVSDLDNDSGYLTNADKKEISELAFTPETLTATVSDEGKIIHYNTGNLANVSAYNASNYVDVSGWYGIKYKRTKTNSTTSAAGMAFYDENKEYLSGIQTMLRQDGIGYAGMYNAVVPQNAKYARFTMLVDTQTYGDFEAYGVTRTYLRLEQKQDALTFDTVPTANSTNPVTSEGIKTALDLKADASSMPTKVSDLTNDAGYLTQHQDISGKTDKVTNATNGNFAALDANGNLIDSEHKHSDYLTSHQDITGKADKVSNATSGNFATLDASGNLVDSGHKHSDYLTEHQDISGKADKTSTITTGNAIVNPDNYATVLPNLNNAPTNSVYVIVPTANAKPANMPNNIVMSQFYTLTTLASNVANGILQILTCGRLNRTWIRVSQNAGAWYAWFEQVNTDMAEDIAESAADAAIVEANGYRLEKITYNTGAYYIRNGSNVIDISSPGNGGNVWDAVAVPCEAGDEFLVSGKAVDNPRLWAFIDSSGNILTMEKATNDLFDRYLIVAPTSAAYLVLNDMSHSDDSYKVIGSIGYIVVASDGSGHYTSLTDGLYSSEKDMVVRAGTYDIPTEYKAKFGNDVFDGLSDNTAGMNMFQYGLYVTERKVTFLPGTKVTCDMDGTEYVYTLDSHHRFSPFNLGSNAVLEGLVCEANKVWYLIHDDFGYADIPYKNVIKNCVLSMTNSINRNIIGGGTKNRSTNIVSGCWMDNGYTGTATPAPTGEGGNGEVIRYHNYNSATATPLVIIENCRANSGFIGARYYGDQTTPKMTFIAHGNSTKSGIIKLYEDSNKLNDNVDLIVWDNIIEGDIPINTIINGKADKVASATNGNFAALDSNGNLTDSGHKHSDYLTSHQDISGKADKVTSATNGNFAGLDANGNLTDSGSKASDFLTEHQSLAGYVQNTDYAAANAAGVVKVDSDNGIGISGVTQKLYINSAAETTIKSGTNNYTPIVPGNQHKSVFYGLAKAAGDTTQASSSNTVGTYTDDAKVAIQTMLGVESGVSFIETISGTDVTITGIPNTKYVCNEVNTISITPPSAGTIIVRFTSGTTAAVLTLPSTVKMPDWWNGVSTNYIYQICIQDSVYGSVMSWPI